MQKLLVSFLVSFLLFACAGQSPAPIEFKSSANSSKSEKIKSRNIKITDDSISAEEVRNNPQEKKDDDKPFVTTREVENHEDNEQKDKNNNKNTIVNSKDLEKEMDELESRDSDSNVSEGQEVGQMISPKKNPHHNASEEKLLFTSPVDGSIISKFGEIYMGKKNSGINISALLGSDIKAVSDGAVIYAGEDPKFGNLIVIKHNKGDLFSAYAHMNDIMLKENSVVKAGQVIGHVGKTGDVVQPQLHFAMRQGKMPVDPLQYIK